MYMYVCMYKRHTLELYSGGKSENFKNPWYVRFRGNQRAPQELSEVSKLKNFKLASNTLPLKYSGFSVHLQNTSKLQPALQFSLSEENCTLSFLF